MKNLLMALTAVFLVAGCAGKWQVNYDAPPSPEVTKTWKLVDVIAVAPDELSVSNRNGFAPSADIVWWGEPFGDRRAQVAAILDEGITAGASDLAGSRPVTMTAKLIRFHSVTPAAIARAPAAVHNISYQFQVFDADSGVALTQPTFIDADLEAYVGSAEIAAAIQGQTQRVRIVDHLAAVTRGWLGYGPDQRREFAGVGR